MYTLYCLLSTTHMVHILTYLPWGVTELINEFKRVNQFQQKLFFANRTSLHPSVYVTYGKIGNLGNADA